MIVINNLTKIYGDEQSGFLALKGINLTLDNGKMTAILGKSGSGKSTLLNILGTLDIPTTGDIYFDNIKVSDLSDKEVSQFRNKKIGYIFQSFYLQPTLTVLDNVCLPLTILGVNKNIREEEARKYLRMLGILEQEKKLVKELSGGQQQRVCIARALINNPDVILADEPTGNLDSENGQEVLKTLKKVSTNGKIVILVTHNVDDAKKYCDRIIYLNDGLIVNDEVNQSEK